MQVPTEPLNWIKEYWIIIIAFISFLYYFYKKEVAKLETWQNKYFKNILVPFHMQYLKNTSMNVKKFMNRIDIYGKEYVPSYLFYLVKKKEYDKIQKILVVDYENNYPSQKSVSLNSLFKIIDVIEFFGNIGIFFLFIASFIIAAVFLLVIVQELIYVLQNNMWSSINYGGTETLAIYMYTPILLFCVFVCIVMILCFRIIGYNDCYSSKEKIILKIIKRRIKNYDKIHNKLIY